MVVKVKMDIQEVGCGGIDRIEVAQDRDSSWALGLQWLNVVLHKILGISLLA